MLPNGWKKVKLGDCFDVQLGKMLNKNAREQDPQYPYIANVNVRWGALNTEQLPTMYFSEREKEKFALKKNDILMCEGGEIGRCTVLKESLDNVFYQKACHRLRAKNNLCSPDYLYFYINHYVTSHEIVGLVGESSIAHLPAEKLIQIQLNLPPIEEQKKIATTLSLWDSAIEKMEKLIEAKSHNFKLLMEKLVVKQSLKKQTKTYSIKELFDVVNRKNKVGNTNVLTSSAQYGLVNQQEYYKKSIASSDISGYYLLEKGDFAYNRSYSTGYPYGVIKRLDKYESGVLSTLYLCMTLKKDYRSLSDYFVFLFESGYLNNQLALICREGARNHGLLNVSKDDFFNMKVQLPSEKEQQNIVCILQNHSCELSLLKQQLENYKKQKQGLMQKLLTGEWRVK
jgi:type I restriction enzyme S subunit